MPVTVMSKEQSEGIYVKQYKLVQNENNALR